MRSTQSVSRDMSAVKTLCPIGIATKSIAIDGGLEVRGAVFTRFEVVDFILNLAGYTHNRALHKKRILEPSFGSGDFLLPIIKRLLTAWRKTKSRGSALSELGNSLRAVELHQATFDETYESVIRLLKEEGLAARTATALASRWLSCEDFLLTSPTDQFDFVVGNPPYVRQELIPAALLEEYRRRYHTMYDRADLYIPFIEKSLSLLKSKGNLSFICADRWIKNRYGGPLRKHIAENFHLKVYVDMVGTPAFHTDVIAYPAITIISREAQGATRIAVRPDIEPTVLTNLANALKAPVLPTITGLTEQLSVVNGAEPWLLLSSVRIALIRRLEEKFLLLEDAECKVGIGVATGADKAFIGNYNELDVEPDRKIPLAMTKDIASGEVQWLGKAVINPFTDEGSLVDLNLYPRLNQYLQSYKSLIESRHCAKKNPVNWYRTIDRITPSLMSKPKLLIPDIKSSAHIVFEEGKLYPHHNLYYIVSDEWDLRALQAVLLSAITCLFVSSYSTKMHGGSIRFQAQYLRRIRLPRWIDVPDLLRNQLIVAATNQDINACNLAAFHLYGLTVEEQLCLKEE